MKKAIYYFIIFTSILIAVDACKPKPACGNTKKNVKKKTKGLEKNKHFNM